MIELILALFTNPAPDYTPVIACETAYVLSAASDEVDTECCGLCEGGKIIHGDGHITDCPCPETCECKTENKAVVHEEVVIPPVVNTQQESCPDGRCKTIRVR
jgi:hypothetical protein